MLETSWLAGLIAVILLCAGCMNEEACEACIDDQISLREALIRDELEPAGSLRDREYYRGACTQAIIAPSAPCKPEYWPLFLLGGTLSGLGLILSLRRRARERASQ